MAFFKSYLPTVVKWIPEAWAAPRFFFDQITGAPTGVQSPSGSGPDGIWAPIPLSAAEIAAPSTQILADLNATYMLNSAPYTRYRSTGSALTAVGDGNVTTIPAGQIELRYSPFTVTEAGGPVIVQGSLIVRELPA